MKQILLNLITTMYSYIISHKWTSLLLGFILLCIIVDFYSKFYEKYIQPLILRKEENEAYKKQQEIDNIKRQQGAQYEKRVAKNIKKYFGNGCYFRNLHISAPTQVGYTEIDGVLIVEQGIFVIEAKSKAYHYNTVSCYPLSPWLVDGYEPIKNPFYQNEYHIKYLQQELDKHGLSDCPLFNIIIINLDLNFNYCGQIIGNSDFANLFDEKKGVVSLRHSHKGMKLLKQAIKQQPKILTHSDIFKIKALFC